IARKTLGSSGSLAAIACRRDVGHEKKAQWVDFNGSLNRETASYLVREVVDSAASGWLPRRVVIEQPIPAHDGAFLSVLQQQIADRLSRLPDSPDIRIMGDEAIWDRESLYESEEAGMLSAINIRPAQAGGLLPSMDLAQALLDAKPEALIVLTRMGGASRVTS